MIRPVFEYASKVWHYNIPNYLSEEIEILQKRALKIILRNLNYTKALDHMKVSTLRESLENLSDKFFKKNDSNLKLQECLP